MPNTKTNSPTETAPADVAAQITALLDQLDTLITGYPEPDVARKQAVRSNARFAGELVSPR